MVLNTPNTWVFLRGLTRESGHWGSFARDFEASIPGSRVVCIDIPGNGHLCAQKSPLTVQAMRDACRDQLLAMGIAAPYGLFGMSMGAMVALSWCSAYAKEVNACVLVNSSMKPFSRFYERLKPANYRQLFRLVLLPSTDEQWERAILNMTSTVKDEAVLPGWLGLRQQHPVTRLNAVRQLWAASRFCAPAQPTSVPTLVLTSDGDELVASRCSYAMAQHWHLPLQIHPHAGHDLALDDGAWVIEKVSQWLADLH